MNDSPYFYPGVTFYQPRPISRHSRLPLSQHRMPIIEENTMHESHARVLQPHRIHDRRLSVPQVEAHRVLADRVNIDGGVFLLRNGSADSRRRHAARLLALADYLDTLEAQRTREERDRQRSALIEEFVSRGFNRTHAILAAGALIPVEPGQA